jgi:hypothetical protein
MCPEDAIGLHPLLRTYYSMREHEVIRSTAGSDSRHYVGSVAPSRQNLSALRPPGDRRREFGAKEPDENKGKVAVTHVTTRRASCHSCIRGQGRRFKQLRRGTDVTRI